MVGKHSGETYRLGDNVTVKLVEAAPVAGALRFELLSAGRKGSARRFRQEERRGDQRPHKNKHKAVRKRR